MNGLLFLLGLIIGASCFSQGCAVFDPNNFNQCVGCAANFFLQRGKCVPCKSGSTNPDCKVKSVQVSSTPTVSKSDSGSSTVKNDKEAVTNTTTNNVGATIDQSNSTAILPDSTAKSNVSSPKDSPAVGSTNAQSTSSPASSGQNLMDNSNLSLNQLIFSMLPAGCCEFKLFPQLECSKCEEKYQLSANKKCQLIQQSDSLGDQAKQAFLPPGLTLLNILASSASSVPSPASQTPPVFAAAPSISNTTSTISSSQPPINITPPVIPPTLPPNPAASPLPPTSPLPSTSASTIPQTSTVTLPPASAPTISNNSANTSSSINASSSTVEQKVSSGVPLLVSFSLQKELAKSSSEAIDSKSGGLFVNGPPTVSSVSSIPSAPILYKFPAGTLPLTPVTPMPILTTITTNPPNQIVTPVSPQPSALPIREPTLFPSSSSSGSGSIQISPSPTVSPTISSGQLPNIASVTSPVVPSPSNTLPSLTSTTNSPTTSTNEVRMPRTNTIRDLNCMKPNPDFSLTTPVSLTNCRCLKCYSGFYFDLGQQLCKPINPLCKTSDPQNRCLSCYIGYILINSKCLVDDGQYVSVSTNSNSPSTPVVQKDLNCQRYGNTGNCQLCSNRYYLSSGVCQPVDSSCKTWDSHGYCLTCYAGYTCGDKDRSCRAFTPPPKMSNLQDYKQFCKSFKGPACTSCVYRYFLSSGYCLPVSDLCNTFNPKFGFCTTCYDGYDLVDGSCQLPEPVANSDPNCVSYSATGCIYCLGGYFLNSQGTCQLVSNLCISYDQSNGFCLSCINPYTLNPSTGECLYYN